jgi:hypothetical protein
MIDFSAPLSGMRQAETAVNQVAKRPAQPPTDSVDLSSDAVSLLSAKDSFAMNTKVAETEDQMTRSELNILG